MANAKGATYDTNRANTTTNVGFVRRGRRNIIPNTLHESTHHATMCRVRLWRPLMQPHWVSSRLRCMRCSAGRSPDYSAVTFAHGLRYISTPYSALRTRADASKSHSLAIADNVPYAFMRPITNVLQVEAYPFSKAHEASHSGRGVPHHPHPANHRIRRRAGLNMDDSSPKRPGNVGAHTGIDA